MLSWSVEAVAALYVAGAGAGALLQQQTLLEMLQAAATAFLTCKQDQQQPATQQPACTKVISKNTRTNKNIYIANKNNEK